MGVTNFWKLIESSKQIIDCVSEFDNKTIAIDLSIWLFEFTSLKISNTNLKMYLRNLIFRTKFLLEKNCKLIFIR